MAALLVDPSETALSTSSYPHRAVLTTAETLVAVAGAAGAVQLWEGTYAPPVEDIEPLGLTTWRVPAVWLFATVAVPSATAACLLYRRSPSAPTAVLVASGLLVTELAVQVPFVGPSSLQAVFGSVSAGLAGLAVHARRTGWSRSTRGPV
jgi:hypothetical protein